MEIQYSTTFRTKPISYSKLINKILNKFEKSDCDLPQSYNELLFILDQHCQSSRCERGLIKELFDQGANIEGKCSLRQLVSKYVENLETAKICLLRDQCRLVEIQSKIKSAKGREQTYVYMEMMQVSIFSRFSKDPTFSYRITPSEIPPIALHNSLNPQLSHQFTLNLQGTSQFNIQFFESGIKVLSWSFPDQPSLPEGEYLRSVKSQNVEFEVKIRYMPRGSGLEAYQLGQMHESCKNNCCQSRQAFKKLCEFQPFLNTERKAILNEGVNIGVTDYVKRIHWLLIAYLLLQCWFSYYVSCEFADIILCFYSLSFIYSYDLVIRGQVITVLICLGLCIIKTFWVVSSPSFYVNRTILVVLAIFCVLVKIVLIVVLGACLDRIEDFPRQRAEFLGDRSQMSHLIQEPIEISIWQTENCD